MKVAHVINNLGSGGAEKLLTDILPAMKRNNLDVALIILNGKANFSKNEEIIRNNSIRIIDLKVGFLNPIALIKMIKVLRFEKFDIVHAHLFPSQYWLSFSSFFISKKTKFIKTEHSVFNERRSNILFKPLEILTYGCYAKIIGITEDVSKAMSDWIGRADKIVTIKNGVNLEEIEQAKKSKSKSDIFKSKNINLLMVGRFDSAPTKDQKILVETLALLDKSYRVYFAGDGPNRQAVEALVEKLNLQDRVTFLGNRSDVYQLMTSTDLNILCTNYEGLSGVALESLASGKPFIGSDVSGVNNVVPDTTFLFKAKSVESLKAKIEQVIGDSDFRDSLLQKSEVHIGSFDMKYMVEAYINVYKLA